MGGFENLKAHKTSIIVSSSQKIRERERGVPIDSVIEEGIARRVGIEVVQVVIPGGVVPDEDRVVHDDLETLNIQWLTDPHAYHVPSGTE